MSTKNDQRMTPVLEDSIGNMMTDSCRRSRESNYHVECEERGKSKY